MSDSNSVSMSEQTGVRSYEEYVQSRTVKTTLGKDDFLSLLAAQLQYQNPLEPMSDTSFIAQLAQFSSLEHMQTMSQSLTTYQYYSLTGQYVYAEVVLEGETEPTAIHGIVDRVVMSDGKAYAQIGEYMVDCSKISQVINKELMTDNASLLDSSKLIGKYIKAKVPDGDNNTRTVTGQVTRVAIEDNFLVAFLDDGTRVGIGDIFDISDSTFTPEPEPTPEPESDPVPKVQE